MTNVKKDLLIGLMTSLVLSILVGWANYTGHRSVNYEWLKFVLAEYIAVFVMAAWGFIQYGLVKNKRDGLAWACLGYIVATPALFVGLWISAKLVHIHVS